MMTNLLSSAFVARTTQLLSSVAHLRLLLVMLLTLCSSANMWGAEVTFDLTKASYNSSSQTEVVWTSTPVTMKIEKGSSSTNANNYLGGTNSNTRCYSGQVFSVSVSSGYELKTIVITSTSSSYIMPTSGWSNATATSNGSVVTVTANSGATVISVNPGDTKRLTKVEITYESSTPAVPCTVTFNAGSGTCDKESETETSAGAGVTLPTPTLTGCDEWSFAGWAISSVGTETTTAPTLLSAGSNYKPTSNCTLYAVYSRTEEGSGGGNETTTFTFSEIANAKSWTNGTAYTTVTIDPVTITAEGGGNNGKYYTSDQTWRMYNGGRLSITSNSNNITAVTSNPDCTFTIDDGTASYSFSETVKFKSITVTTSGGSGFTIYYHSTPSCSTKTLVSVLPKIMKFWQSIFRVSLGYLRDKTGYRHVLGGIVVVSLHHRCTKIDFHHINMSRTAFVGLCLFVWQTTERFFVSRGQTNDQCPRW